PTEEGLLGDVDLSGTIDVTDLSTLSLSLVDKKDLKGQSFKNADVTKDGKVDLTDLATLRQYLSKKITKF
ncbi:MAG: dockerin type I repeat-containing protein, partial [Oscillospiraceae bacterium]|nr:dockerin type I repeat-containing protein [Oscillospiraceae bacterium]